ncbi:hypothetical protein T440DRAFT_220739 [Plenodomus tracheiphilus IPT5]|uniref:F-box domain-containing protein n=1 Tax=Plenodomus tracheiphilus IPT5 TaxID=1408161 RepID=A0A6A7AXF5_9PLEO|nr:hypothetical protein T440DRAFT_220739 [Plenodomus tracheiphilus IPT5]
MEDNAASTTTYGRSKASEIVLSQRMVPKSHFLRLPGESKNEIYACLTDKYHLKSLRRPKRTKSIFIHPRRHRLALLRVCREIHAETALLPFKLNKFHFCSFVGIEVLCVRITEQQRTAIQAVHLNINLWERPNRRYTMDAMIQNGVDTLPSLLPGLRSVNAQVIWRPTPYDGKTQADMGRYSKKLKAWMHGDRGMSGEVIAHYGWKYSGLDVRS